MLLTRFNIRRLRFAITPVSHTDGNRATCPARGRRGPSKPSACGDGRPFDKLRAGSRPSSPRQTEHFRCSGVIAPIPRPCQSSLMLRKLLLMFVMLGIASSECAAVPKPHVITFGKWISAKWPNATGQKLLDLKVRPLFVDTRLKESTTTHMGTAALKTARSGKCDFNLPQPQPQEAPPPQSESRLWRSSPAPPKPR